MGRFVSSAPFASNAPRVHDDPFLMEQLIRQVQGGFEPAAAQLRECLARGLRWYLNRQGVPASQQTRQTGEVLDAVITAIERGQIADVAAVASFTRHCAQRCLGKAARETASVDRRSVDCMKQALRTLNSSERELALSCFTGGGFDSCDAIDFDVLNKLKARMRE